MLPLGIASIASYAAQASVHIDAFDFGNFSGEVEVLLQEYPQLQEYDVVGLSFYNTNALTAFALANVLRTRNRQQTIVAGGPHPASCSRDVLLSCPSIDVVIKGEGEEPFLDIVRMGKRLDFRDIAGAVWRNEGNIVDNGAPAKVRDLNALPPPSLDFVAAPPSPLVFYDRRDGRRRRAVAMTTSRSCPYSCSFCAIILIGRDWRRVSVGKAIDDFVSIDGRYGPFEHVYFMDANFFVDSNRAIAIAEGLAATPSKPTFSFSTRANQVVRASHHLRRLTDLGLRAIEMGVESASEAALSRFSKDTTPDQNDQAIRLLADHNIHLIFDFIMFDAEASLDDLSANIDFLERHGLDTYIPWDHLFSWLTPYHGTPIRQRYESTLGIMLPLHELPDPEVLFKDLNVRRVFVEMKRFASRLPILKQAVMITEAKVRSLGINCVEGARSALNAVTLRRLPFRVLRSLIAQARQQSLPSLETASPPFFTDAGETLTMDEFLDKAGQPYELAKA